MKLTEWLAKNRVSDADFAKRIGVSRQALWRYKAEDRLPKREILERIKTETGGEVCPADFFASPDNATAPPSGQFMAATG